MTEQAPLLSATVPVYPPLASSNEASPKPNALPPANQYPQVDYTSGWKDRGFAIAFWIHALLVIILGFALGIPAIRDDIQHSTYDDPKRTLFDFNADLFIRIFICAAAVGGFASFVAFLILQRCAGRIIKCSLYMGVVMQLVLCISLFTFAWPMGIITLIFVLISLWYIYYVRNRIPFAEAHLQVGCAALRSHWSLVLIAIGMLVVQLLWIIFWSMMALGFEHALNGPTPGPYINVTDLQDNLHSDRRSSGGVFTFVLLVSLYWGVLTFRNVVHFITACVVGQWWFTADASRQYAVEFSVKRAFTTNFGTISFGSLLVAIIKALRVCAQSNQNAARREGNIALAFVACCAACILQILENLLGYLNEWAFIYAALTGQAFIKASRSFIELFKDRGWTMIINDDLTGNALAIVSIAVGFFSAAVGGLAVYISMPHASERAGIAGMAAFFSFLIGMSMSTVMTSILSSCVRTAFVCFALNPTALGSTHPEHLSNLVNAWYKFHPQEFAASGYAYYLPKPASAETAYASV